MNDLGLMHNVEIRILYIAYMWKDYFMVPDTSLHHAYSYSSFTGFSVRAKRNLRSLLCANLEQGIPWKARQDTAYKLPKNHRCTCFVTEKDLGGYSFLPDAQSTLTLSLLTTRRARQYSDRLNLDDTHQRSPTCGKRILVVA